MILNEVEQAKKIIKNGNIGNKPSTTLFLLARYYIQKEHLSKQDTFAEINNFMKQYYKDYNSAAWENIIEDICKKANKYPLREIDGVDITQNELDKISTLPNIKYKKLVFTMLCYAKLYNIQSEKNNGWVNTKIKDIYDSARVIVKHKKDRFLYLNDLENLGFISFSSRNDNLNLRIVFIDKNDNSPTLFVNDFRELGYEYLNYLNPNDFARCSECNRLIRKTNNKIKYCSNCSKNIKNEQNKKYYKQILGK